MCLNFAFLLITNFTPGTKTKKDQTAARSHPLQLRAGLWLWGWPVFPSADTMVTDDTVGEQVPTQRFS